MDNPGIGIDGMLRIMSRSVNRDNSEDRKVSSRIPLTLAMETHSLLEVYPCRLLFAGTSVFCVSGRHWKGLAELKKVMRTRYHVKLYLGAFLAPHRVNGKMSYTTSDTIAADICRQ